MVATTIPLSSTLIDLRVVWRAPSMVRPSCWLADIPSECEFIRGEFVSVEDMAAHFNTAILQAAGTAIPKSTGNSRHPFVPWWNLDCSRAVGARKKALARLKHYPSADNHIDYKRCRAKARRTILESKNASWKAYVSSLNCHTPPRLVWRKVRLIKGYPSSYSVPGLRKNCQIITDRDAVVEELATHYEKMSSSANYSPNFLSFKERMENRALDFSSRAHEDYNTPFSMYEMRSALKLAKRTTPGPDEIHNLMLQHLPETAMEFLLRLFNRIWKSILSLPCGEKLSSSQFPKWGKMDHCHQVIDLFPSQAV